MDTTAVVFEAPGRVQLRNLSLVPASSQDAIVAVQFSGISTGTEKLLWTGDMPHFPGLGYPLVPGYETVGRVITAPVDSDLSEGDFVYVPGASCYGDVRGLFGGAANRIAAPASKLVKVPAAWGEKAVLLALAATAHHAATMGRLPELIIGHGALGCLTARVTRALGGAPVVWELASHRQDGEGLYPVLTPSADTRTNYRTILDASGDNQVLDRCMQHLAKRGEIVLAGFYSDCMQFVFPPAFMREATIRIAAEWVPGDLKAVVSLVASGSLSLEGIVTHQLPASEAESAYDRAFNDPTCRKMILDWRTMQ